MIFKLPSFAAFLLLATSATTALQVVAGPGEEALTTFFEEVRSFRADFTQRVLSEQSAQIQTSTGTVVLHRPGQFRWRYQEPYHQEIVGDGAKVWIYDEDLEQVTVRPQDETLGNTPAQVLSTDEPLTRRFDIKELGEQSGLNWVELSPTQTDATFSAIRLAFRDQELVAMELTDSLGNQTVLTFTNVERNPTIAADTFRFDVPSGVDVIGEQE